MNQVEPQSLKDWQELFAKTRLDARPFIGNQRSDAPISQFFDVVNPFTDKVLTSAPRCGSVEINAAVATARKAFEDGSWSLMAASKRSEVLCRLADLIEANGPELALLDTIQMGIPVSLAMPDIQLAAKKLREAAAGSERLFGMLLPSSSSCIALNLRVPQGVVGAITPWNFPLFVALGKVGAALATGNCVVLKPSEIAPLACLRLADLATEAGLPSGVLNVVPGLGPEAGRALASHLDVDMLSFTGSTATGRALMQAAAESNLKALHLELGGKSPQVVLDDCGDLAALAQQLADGFMFNGGQLCVAGTRLVLAQELATELPKLIAEKTGAWKFGNPLDPATLLGPLASRLQCERVRRFMSRASQSGFDACTGPHGENKNLPVPTIFTGVPSSAEIFQEEVFGPVAVSSSFDTDTQAIELANGTKFGLVANVWSSDFVRGHAVATKIKAGAVTLNTRTTHEPPRTIDASIEPAGESGFGAEGGIAGLMAFTRARHLLMNLPRPN